MAEGVAERLGHRVLRRPELVAVDGGDHRRRALLLRPGLDDAATAADLAAFFGPGGGPLMVEAPFAGGPDLRAHGYRVEWAMSVMTRAPRPGAGPPPAPPDGTTVERVEDPATLAVAERVVSEGFPMQFAQGRLFDPALLGLPGFTLRLARRDGEAAAAAAVFDDGRAAGVYYVATLPHHRGQGLARALMDAVLAAHRDRTATLTATAAGEPLYRALGFEEVGRSTWWRR